jgi:hypothetical protein
MKDTAWISVLFAMMMALQMMTDPRITRQFIRKTMVCVAIYLVHTAIGIGLLFLLIRVGRGPNAIVGVLTAFVGWILLGVLGLIRFVPRLREPPRWLMHVGIADAVCLLVIAAGIAMTFGLF